MRVSAWFVVIVPVIISSVARLSSAPAASSASAPFPAPFPAAASSALWVRVTVRSRLRTSVVGATVLKPASTASVSATLVGTVDEAAGALPGRRRGASCVCYWRVLRSIRCMTWGRWMRLTRPLTRFPLSPPSRPALSVAFLGSLNRR